MTTTPTQPNPNFCPTKYDCRGIEVSTTKCFYQGNSYAIGQTLPKNSKGFSTNWETNCVCSSEENRTKVTCAQTACIDYASGPTPGCYWKYNLQTCCAIGETCPPFESTRCLVDGVEYKAGERFTSRNSCHICLCQNEWNGKFEAPFCKKSSCDVQLSNQREVQQACAPVYKAIDEPKNCCPRNWVCSDGDEVVEDGGRTTDLTCRFGNLTLKVGDAVRKEIRRPMNRVWKVRCECKIPPLLTCY